MNFMALSESYVLFEARAVDVEEGTRPKHEAFKGVFKQWTRESMATPCKWRLFITTVAELQAKSSDRVEGR